MDLPHLYRRQFLWASLATMSSAMMSTWPGDVAAKTEKDNERESSHQTDGVTLFLAGDVMVGRGIDQVLPHPSDPKLYEPYVASAVDYVELAERANGPIPRPVDFTYVWGDGLTELDRRRPDIRVVNLETAVTNAQEPAPKGINYKINPANSGVLTAARLDCCALANNHALDWGPPGLLETLETLKKVGIKEVGAGRDALEAAAPAIIPVRGGRRVVIFGFGSVTSGIPRLWQAGNHQPGINLLPDLSPSTAAAIAQQVRKARLPGDIVVASIHWGANWGYDISDEQIAFAHALIDGDVDVVFGHSSHHPKAIEVYRDKLVLYGCGDLLNDYEGIGGYELYRSDLALMYFPTVEAGSGTLAELVMVPFQLRKFRLDRVSGPDAAWLSATLNKEGEKFGTRVFLNADNTLALQWG